MNYLDKISELESKSNLTIEDVKGFENEIKSLNLDENMQTYVQSKILKLKVKCNSGSKKWDLFLNEISEYENIDEVIEFLVKLDELKDSFVDKKTLNELEKQYSKIILPILHDTSRISKYYRDLCIKEVNKKLKVFHNRIERTINPKFGERIKELREAKGMSLKDLEHVSGVTSSYVHRIEKGLRKPSVEKIEKLADALDADFKELLDLLNIGFILNDKNEKKNETDLIKLIKSKQYKINGIQLSDEKQSLLNEILNEIINEKWTETNELKKGFDLVDKVKQFKMN